MEKKLQQSYEELAPLSNGWRKEFKLHKNTLNLLNKHIPDIKQKKILDVGCGLGVMVHALNKLGASAQGIDKHILEEWGIKGVEKLWSEKQLKINVGDFLTADYSAGQFDAIICEDVFEHLNYTHKEFLDKIYGLLAPGGILILATPNLTSWHKRARMLFGKSPYWDLKDFYLNKQPYGHTREFTAQELRQMARMSKFEVADIRHYNIYLNKAWLKMPKKYPAILTFLASGLFPRGRDTICLVARKR